MRIPLDYYRILSVPIKASPQQLEQAYGDRAQQQPRREYNERTISARLRLIEEAYGVLADEKRRSEYDTRFFTSTALELASNSLTTSPTPSQTDEGQEETEAKTLVAAATAPSLEKPPINPTIDVLPQNFVGALSIMHELGEYELVLKLGMDYSSSADYTNFQKQLDKEDKIAYEKDIILSLALAYLELGREQWHRREYESAAKSGQMGLDLLSADGLFSSVQQELEVDLYKLRPYRILELIAKNSLDSPKRERGFQLLAEMLRQRQGIEGTGEDHSGLTFDQFLCFIQQLRSYLTSEEQVQLFATEDREDSAIASYLATYALMARGFALKQPQAILQAQNSLKKLSQCQDVYWEQAICALLLSNAPQAVDTLQKSQDLKNIELIQQEDPEGKDLLPGLCLHGEKWLQEEVLAQFCDLETARMTLKEYFADLSVQSYLDSLCPAVVDRESPAVKKKSAINDRKVVMGGFLARWRKRFTAKEKAVSSIKPTNRSANREKSRETGAKTGVNYQKKTELGRNGSISLKNPLQKSTVSLKANPQNLTSRGDSRPRGQKLPAATPKKAAPNSYYANRQAFKPKKSKKLSPSTMIVGWLFIASMVLSVGGLGFVSMRLLLNRQPFTAKKDRQLKIALAESTVKIPPATPVKAVPEPKVTFSDRAYRVIQTWLNSKSAAFGKEYQIDELNKILAPPLLATWRDRAVAYQQGQSYREYDHKITVRSAKIDPNNKQQAVVEAEVKEVAKHYQNGQLDSSQSYDDNLLVRYNLILQGNKWLINNAEVLKTL